MKLSAPSCQLGKYGMKILSVFSLFAIFPGVTFSGRIRPQNKKTTAAGQVNPLDRSKSIMVSCHNRMSGQWQVMLTVKKRNDVFENESRRKNTTGKADE